MSTLQVPSLWLESQTLTKRPARVNAQLTRVSSAPFKPITLAALAEHLREDESVVDGQITDQDSVFNFIIDAAYAWMELNGLTILRSRWTQVQDRVVKDQIPLKQSLLAATPNLVIVYYDDAAPATPVTLDSSLYYVVNNTVQLTEPLPVVPRKLGGIQITYNSGYVDYPDNPNAEQIATAQAAVKPQDRLALFNLCGYLSENREGSGAQLKYQVQAKLAGITPEVVQLLTNGRITPSLLGNRWHGAV